MADASEVGKYGTIRVLKRKDPSACIAVYPLDEDECTFGRNTDCSIRLYYPEVSSLHCKIIFEERKAFLQVFGESGAIVDGCQVYPANDAKGVPATVPLVNGSYFEVHKKRFQFSYPPKEIRQQLFTPEGKRRKSVRMSMILSANVFSPRPSANPRENLRVLQSPLKPFAHQKGEEPEVIKLVDGNHPRVVEEEQDLIIFEDVQPNPPQESPTRSQTMPSLPQQQVLKTPRRRSAPSLHRAVLIRSAQRTAYLQEMFAHQRRQGNEFEEVMLEEDENEDEQEEVEVEEAVSGELFISDESDEERFNEDDRNSILGGLDEPIVEEHEENEQDITEARDDYEEEDNDVSHPPSHFATPLQVSRARTLGSFMTPQNRLLPQRPSKEDQPQGERVGPQRPPPGARLSLAPGLGAGTLSYRELEPKAEERPPSPVKKKPEITEEERKAIIERRKSAVQAPEPDFPHVPGLGARRSSALPPLAPPSPFKSIRENIDDGEDTKTVMKKMEESLEGMRRKSFVGMGLGRPSIGIGKGGNGPESPPKPASGFSLLSSPARSLGQRLFVASPTKPLRFEEAVMEEDEEDEESGHKENVKLTAVDAFTDADEEEENDENKQPDVYRIGPATPRLGDIRHLFSRAQPDAGIASPVIRGVRELFRADMERVDVPKTPRMSGVRQLFIERKVPPTPTYDGIEELMHLDEEKEDIGVSEIQAEEDDSEGHEAEKEQKHAVKDDDFEEHSHSVKPSRVPTRIPKTAARTKVTRALRETPLTGSSTMADDEATPDPTDADTRSRATRNTKPGVPEAAVVHRGGRAARKLASADSDVEGHVKTKPREATKKKAAIQDVEELTTEAEPPAKTPTRRGRIPKAKTEEPVPALPASDADTQPKAKPRGRARKIDAVAESEMKIPAASAAKMSRRGGKSTPTDDESTAPAKALRRGTRARSQSVDPEAASLASTDPSSTTEKTTRTTKRTARSNALSEVETTAEEEGPKVTKPASRTRKAKTESDESHDETAAPAARRAGGRKAAKATLLVTVEEAEDKNDKENNPDSPIMSPTEFAGEAPVKPTRKTTTRAIKPPSRSMSARSQTDEDSLIPTRTTRTRSARK